MVVTHPSLDDTLGSMRLARLAQGLVRRGRTHHTVLAMASGDGTRRWSATANADPNSPFFIASITKRFIITLVLQAHERGELDLAAPITHYLGTDVGLHVRNGTDRTVDISVRHLASHTAGLPDYFEHRGDGPGLMTRLRTGHDAAWTYDDVVRTTRERQRPHFDPQDLTAARQKARYSDTGFQVLIRIVETATGRAFGGLLAERILRPLELNDTWLPSRPRPRPGPAPLPIYARQRRLDLPLLMESSNDLFSTTGDLLTFHRALLAGDLFNDAGTVALLTERRNRLRNIPVLRYGLGTMIFRINRLGTAGRSPVTLVGHSGVTGTWLFHCPELDVHLAGTVDQARGQAMPFRLMARCLNIWRS
jgi:CubicO group peptidase (beta-lactamase class C family)